MAIPTPPSKQDFSKAAKKAAVKRERDLREADRIIARAATERETGVEDEIIEDVQELTVGRPDDRYSEYLQRSGQEEMY